jgi:WXXGXW repeat (2 copies)
MKRIISIGILFIVSIACSPSTSVVTERPAPPVVVVRTAAPYPHAIWVGDEWRWKHGRYVYVRPHYVKSRRGAVWIDGHWKNTPRGFVWLRGHWR